MSKYDNIVLIDISKTAHGPVAHVGLYEREQMTAHELEQFASWVSGKAKELRKLSDQQARRARGGFGN